MWPSIFAAVSAYGEALARMSPEQRASYLAEQRELRENEELESSDEVRLAREYIAEDGLRGEFADQLLGFARDLARRRRN